jgi:hypothetical protein
LIGLPGSTENSGELPGFVWHFYFAPSILLFSRFFCGTMETKGTGGTWLHPV